MLTMHWTEDKEGSLAVTWYDDETAERGCFAEHLVPVEQSIDLYSLFPELAEEFAHEDDEITEVTVFDTPRVALACSR